MCKSGKKALRAAHKRFMREYPNAYTFTYKDFNGIIHHMLHLGFRRRLLW